MGTKRTGISPSLLIHPGETIADVLQERQITQGELAARMALAPASVAAVIDGRADISESFAVALERALDVPRSFWLNLQANYNRERLELNGGTVAAMEDVMAGRGLTGPLDSARETMIAALSDTQ